MRIEILRAVQQFNIPFLTLPDNSSGIEQVFLLLDQKQRHEIKFAPWPAFNYKPNVAFSIAHNGKNIFLKYYVEEDSVIAIHRETNGPVFKDSCVEFFIGFDDEKEYYNIEFNCAGTCLMGYGNGKEGRKQLQKKIIEEIKYQVLFETSDTSPASIIRWELCLTIPVNVFYYHKLDSFTNRSCKVNFYKCGDELPQPHYLSWTELFSADPNFHLPEFFENAYFADNEKNTEATDKAQYSYHI